jgi:hypothetical protein
MLFGDMRRIGKEAGVLAAWGGELDAGAVGEWQGNYWSSCQA